MLKQSLIAALLILIISCTANKKQDATATEIIKQSIQKHGGKNYQDMDIAFDYRQFRVHLKQKEGHFFYERIFTDSLNNKIHDVLTNEDFIRKINGEQQELTAKDQEKYKEGINAVAYFVLLPYKLSEPAVKLKYLGETTINNVLYNKIGVSFDKEGGGKDHHDEFCYWINKNTHTLDYLSYSSGGPRFRKAIKRETVDGIIFQDYENYAMTDSTISVNEYDRYYVEGKMKLLSNIEQSNYASEKTKN